MINQTKFPFLWLLFQYVMGGNVDKKRLVLNSYHGEQKVLEVGCSVGNIADTFLSVEKIAYQGVDIDANAIALAQRRFKKRRNFVFTCAALEQFSQTGQKFDLIYFAGVLHHVSDDEAVSLLRSALPLLHAHTRLVIIEPQRARNDDAPLVRWYANVLEQGAYLRSIESLQAIVYSALDLTPGSTLLAPIGATPFSWPLCANFIVIETGIKP
jgi:ubiquinone/menaquinone biosynthesis C-methylase UbiE